jgi:hypothetical protein
MRIDERVRKCVAFVCGWPTRRFGYLGPLFFWFGRDVDGQDYLEPSYLVTARHVIDSIRKTGVDRVWLRLNHSNGSACWLHTRGRYRRGPRRPLNAWGSISTVRRQAPHVMRAIWRLDHGGAG